MPCDELTSCYTDLLDGSYTCLDRLVLNANFAHVIQPVAFVGGGDNCTMVPMRNWTMLI